MAAVVAARAMAAQPGDVAIPDARLDRLVLMRVRELPPGGGRSTGRVAGAGALRRALQRLRAAHHHRRLGEGWEQRERKARAPRALPAEAGEALDAARETLTQTELEAFALREVEGRGEIEAAQAMNCSRSATERAHARGAEKLEEALGMSAEQAARLLRTALDESDPELVLHRHRELRRTRLRRRALRALAFALILAAIGVGGWALWRLGGAEEPSESAVDGTEAGEAP